MVSAVSNVQVLSALKYHRSNAVPYTWLQLLCQVQKDKVDLWLSLILELGQKNTGTLAFPLRLTYSLVSFPMPLQSYQIRFFPYPMGNDWHQ